MPTHYATCIVCGKLTGCADDTYVLGAGASCYENGQQIEFCTVACFRGLRRRLDERAKIADEQHPEWGPG